MTHQSGQAESSLSASRAPPRLLQDGSIRISRPAGICLSGRSAGGLERTCLLFVPVVGKAPWSPRKKFPIALS